MYNQGYTLVLRTTGTLSRAVGQLDGCTSSCLPPSVVAAWRRHRFLNAAKAIGIMYGGTGMWNSAT